MSHTPVRVEVFPTDGTDPRQIGPNRRLTTLLQERADDIGTAVRDISRMLRESVESEPEESGFRVSTVTSTFGLSLATSGGVVVTRASAEVSFEVTLTIERA
ncbi:CU044_2847 family protein [Plantactinospora veratri]|uniref:CU044_2847 family protein n=1 Tax=Plantactinospora veratri TaxID=1436122 RepID=A0ABU7SKE1_9ACTN